MVTSWYDEIMMTSYHDHPTHPIPPHPTPTPPCQVYMFGEWYKPGATLEYPMGGTGAIVDALIRGLEKHGGRLCLNKHVEEVVVEGGRAAGVQLRGGKRVTARKAVVSNASMWDTVRLLPPGVVGREEEEKVEGTPQCPSFMHLHLGIDAKVL